MRGLHRIASLVVGLGLTGCVPSPTHVVWTDHGTLEVRRLELVADAESELLGAGIQEPWNLAVDSDADLVFWNELKGHAVVSLPVGSDPAVIVPNEHGEIPTDVALDDDGRLFYGTRVLDTGDVGGRIVRIAADGSDRTVVLTTKREINSVAVDRRRERIVWSEVDVIWAAGLDGSGAATLIDVSSGGQSVKALAIDECTGDVYWSETGPQARRIRSCRADGSVPRTLVSNADGDDVSYPFGIVVDNSPSIPIVYWADINFDWIARCDGKGENFEVVHRAADDGTDRVYHPTGIALGYWD